MEINIKIPSLISKGAKKRLERIIDLSEQRIKIDLELEELLSEDSPPPQSPTKAPKRTYKPRKAKEPIETQETTEPGVCGECGRGSYNHNVSCSKRGSRRVKGKVQHECCGSKQQRHKKSCTSFHPVNSDPPKENVAQDGRGGFQPADDLPQLVRMLKCTECTTEIQSRADASDVMCTVCKRKTMVEKS